MNLRLMFEVLGPLRLSFRIFCIKYAKKQRFQLFIWCKARFYSSIYIKVTGKNVKNRYFDFSRFCKKNLSKCCELISISIAFKMAPIKQSNLKIKVSTIEFYKLHSKKGHGCTYNQWKHKKKAKAERNWPWYCNPNVENLKGRIHLAKESGDGLSSLIKF